MFISALFTIARTWKQLRCPLADEWIRKLWYIFTKDYYSAIWKNTFESVLMRLMKLELIIQSVVSQKGMPISSISQTGSFRVRLAHCRNAILSMAGPLYHHFLNHWLAATPRGYLSLKARADHQDANRGYWVTIKADKSLLQEEYGRYNSASCTQGKN